MAKLGMWFAQKGFGLPSGLFGRLGGRIMARGNAATERHLVALAELRSDESVLVIGPGPGVGLRAAAGSASRVVGVDPSKVMLSMCRRECAAEIEQRRVELVQGTAEDTGLAAASCDVAIAVNNVQIWPDQPAGFAELARVLRPGGRLLLSAHEKWLSGGLEGLAATVRESGFAEVLTWTWDAPERGAARAAQLSAYRP